MIKCGIDLKTGSKEVYIKGSLPVIVTELEVLIRKIRESMESNNVPKELQNEILEVAFEDAKLSQKEADSRKLNEMSPSNPFKKFVENLIKTDEE